MHTSLLVTIGQPSLIIDHHFSALKHTKVPHLDSSILIITIIHYIGFKDTIRNIVKNKFVYNLWQLGRHRGYYELANWRQVIFVTIFVAKWTQ